MVKKVNVSIKQLEKLYYEVKQASNTFRDINAKILVENSQRIVIFRLSLGLSNKMFAKICKRSNACIYNLEKKARWINFSTAAYYANVLTNLDLKNLDKFEIIKRNYDRFFGRALTGVKLLPAIERKKFAIKGSLKALKTRNKNKEDYYKASRAGLKSQALTTQEKDLTKILEKNEIDFKTHWFIGKENVDIFIDKENPIVISCSQVKNNKNITKHARRLMYQAYRIKHNNPNVKYIAVLGNSSKTLKNKDLHLGAIELLKEICDMWFVDSNIEDIVHYITG